MRKLLVPTGAVALLMFCLFAVLDNKGSSKRDKEKSEITHPVRISEATETDAGEVENATPEGFHATAERLELFEGSVEPGEKFVTEGIEEDDGTIVFATITPTLQSVDDQVMVVLSVERIEVESGVEQTVSMPRLLMLPSRQGMVRSVVSDTSGKPVGGWSMQLSADVGEEGRISLSGSTAMY